MRGKYLYAVACKEANDWVDMLQFDPMTRAMHVPVDEIIEGYMRKHVKKCEACREKTFQANMP